ncbi:sushi, von Willebrand factor type A, EGF and pentraxin domain-containing protein 1-like isoform X1 [Centruroides sculpturatus]|uniref:sushi, von Willebrand factor type A, EGF and pentraxin domain-containing protein 1-like isoform X1 n=1 Tax=Centruroides sculpturatus TaxID=218467 RepID=UPI000C6CAD5E|nr:sushi, von Willebrand factor type A, EGF and pentraxin domain-containing protein 1-like isoform X1 [Centruroides sculpturatus]
MEHQLVDPEGCPRDREEAASTGRQCLRKCQSDGECISSRKRCLCDGLCGWSCVRPDLHCDELTAIENGQFKVTGDHFGARVHYTCDEAFWMSGSKERVCQGDGSWSDRSPECRRKAMCGAPPQILHARHNGTAEKDEYDVDALVDYTCFPGYDASGYSRAKCLFHNGTTQWFGLELRCIPRSCGIPGEVENGRREGDLFTFTSRVTYHCLDGYELVGRANRYCQSNGEWSGVLPSCRPIECPIPANPPNGRALFTVVSYNSVVKYDCKYGYRLAGQVTRTCGPNKQWEGSDPVCEEIDCGNPGELYNGHLKGSNTRLGAVLLFRCLDDMVMEGDYISTTCLQDGTWSHPLPKCLAPCTVPEIDYGRVNEMAPGSKVNHGENITVDCIPHYDLRYNVTPAICNNGTWTHKPTCVPARCKKLPKRPLNGMVIAPKTDHGMKALFRCNDGYELEGPNVTECNFGRWSVQTPACNVVYCKFPGYLENGRILLVGHMGMYDYRPYVKKVPNDKQVMYECNRHYTLSNGPSGATCVAGKWSPKELPQCVKGSHPNVRWIRSVRNRREKAIRRFQRQDINRFRRNKFGRKKQRRTKDWCPLIDNVPWMRISIVKMGKGNEDVPHGTVVRAQCYRGYLLNIGNRTARCVRGKWKPMEPQCVTSPCPVPLVKNGVYHHFGLTVNNGSFIPHGELVFLQCETGFQLVGSESSRCWYGQWSTKKMPECVPGPCVLPIIEDGYYLGGYRAGLTISHQSSIDYSCSSAHEKASADTIRCIKGQLLPQEPRCDKITPSLPPATYTKKKWKLYGELTDAASLANTRRSCSLPKPLKQSLIFNAAIKPSYLEGASNNGALSKYPHGTEILYKCLVPLRGKKISWKIICEDGNWIGRAEECDEKIVEYSNKNCTFKRTDQNLVMFIGDRKLAGDLIEFETGTEIIFRCRDIGKYQLRGSIRLRCRGGKWDGIPPICIGLSQESDYALEKPPTILFRHRLGEIAQSNEGKLLVYPGTILHLECLWIRKYGTPRWEIRTSANRKYPEGWTNEPGRDPQLEYRLSIYHAQRSDSGIYTCITPMNHRHSINILVIAIDCPPVPQIYGLYTNTNKRMMNTKLVFHCEEPKNLIGSEKATCLPSGRWSAPFPHCIATECPDPSKVTSPPMKIISDGFKIGKTARFSCPKGSILKGSDKITCLDTGQWSAPIPYCTKETCEPPELPIHGHVIGNKSYVYRHGDMLLIGCDEGYMADGPIVLVCQEDGRWSSDKPQCLPVCSYPGSTEGAILSPVKFYYTVNETVIFECLNGYKMKGSKIIQCLKDGKWSSSIPTCESLESNQ